MNSAGLCPRAPPMKQNFIFYMFLSVIRAFSDATDMSKDVQYKRVFSFHSSIHPSSPIYCRLDLLLLFLFFFAISMYAYVYATGKRKAYSLFL